MKPFIRKLKSKKGESLAEILIAILIIAFGCMLIAAMYSASMSMNLDAQDADKDFYDAITKMESMGSGDKSGDLTVGITDENGATEKGDIKVDRYGSGGLSSYRKQP